MTTVVSAGGRRQYAYDRSALRAPQSRRHWGVVDGAELGKHEDGEQPQDPPANGEDYISASTFNYRPPVPRRITFETSGHLEWEREYLFRLD